MTEPDQIERGSRTDAPSSRTDGIFSRRFGGRRTCCAAIVIAAGATLTIDAHADGTADLRGLLEETVVTTASKTKETGTNAPATSTTLTADDMRRYGIHTIDEAINFLSLGGYSYNPFYTPDVSVRGVGI